MKYSIKEKVIEGSLEEIKQFLDTTKMVKKTTSKKPVGRPKKKGLIIAGFKKDIEDGLHAKDIAKKVGVGLQSVYNFACKNKIKFRKNQKIKCSGKIKES